MHATTFKLALSFSRRKIHDRNIGALVLLEARKLRLRAEDTPPEPRHPPRASRNPPSFCEAVVQNGGPHIPPSSTLHLSTSPSPSLHPPSPSLRPLSPPISHSSFTLYVFFICFFRYVLNVVLSPERLFLSQSALSAPADVLCTGATCWMRSVTPANVMTAPYGEVASRRLLL